MEQLQPKYTNKVKLKLEQPSIICSGRDRVECYYRGKITSWIIGNPHSYFDVTFKSKGEIVTVTFRALDDVCLNHGWEDLKIVK